MEMKNYEQGMKVLSPSIFRKSKGPIVLAASAAALAASGQFDSQARPGQPSSLLSKKPDSSNIAKEFSLQDYDLNACLDLKDVHCKSFWLNKYTLIE
jgi:hypothetical protein